MARKTVNNITNLVLEGKPLSEAIALTEAVLDAESISDFVKGPFYKGLEKNAQQMLKQVEDADGYRDERETDPRGYTEEELDNLEYVANMLSGLRLVNYDEKIKAGVAKLIRSAEQGVKRGHRKLDAMKTDQEILDGFKPLEYYQRALCTMCDAFNLLGVQWDYDYKWQNYLFDADPKKSAVKTQKTADGRRVIDVGVPTEERQQEMFSALIEASADSISFNDIVQKIKVKKSEAHYFTSIWDNFGLDRKVKSNGRH